MVVVNTKNKNSNTNIKNANTKNTKNTKGDETDGQTGQMVIVAKASIQEINKVLLLLKLILLHYSC